MTAPLHERLAEAAKAADSWPWVTEPRGGHHIYTDHCDESGNGIKCPAIGIHPDHSPWKETKDFILLAQPANVAKLCEQVRVMKEALVAIELIKDRLEGGDWDEIEEARSIASLALLSTREDQ